MATFLPVSTQKFRYQIGHDTDIGGGRENQDACFVWKRDDLNLIVMGVLDGHGREVGKVAAEAAKKCLISLLDAECQYLLVNPVEFLVRAHEVAHNFIRESFQKELEAQGYQIEQTSEKYLLKRKNASEPWACVHGGTSCTLLALVEHSLYIANVGDSTALLCTSSPVLHKQLLQYEVDAAARECGEKDREQQSQSAHSSPSCSALSSGADTCLSGVTDHSSASAEGQGNLLVLSAEHSPESAYEFRRLRRFRARDTDPRLPALSVVYDSPSHDKSQCYAVFPLASDANGNGDLLEPLVPSGRGSYYKNVRREWASLVATPKSAHFQDALAFTRSLGDLHLHTYGVTHLPEIQRIDLQEVFRSLGASAASSGGEASGVAGLGESAVCVVLATDGVWDNWLYEDVQRFMFDASCLNALTLNDQGAQRITTSFMRRNAMFSKKNFGAQADNATGLVLYLTQHPSLCQSSDQ